MKENAQIKAEKTYTITGTEIIEINGLIGDLPIRCGQTADRILGVIIKAVNRQEEASGNNPEPV